MNPAATMSSTQLGWGSIVLDLGLLVSDLKLAAWLFVHGLVDSFRLCKIKEVWSKHKELRSLLWDVFWLNALVFLGSNALYHFVLPPFFDWLFRSESENVQLLYFWLTHVFDFFWNAVWVFPFYVVSLVIGGSRYDKIAEIVYKQFPQRLENRNRGGDVALTIAAQVQKITLIWLFNLIAIIWSAVPYVGFPISTIYNSWLYALYSFEYRWTWLYPDREPALHLRNMEYYYIYYCGFGFPFAILMGIFPFLIGGGVYAFVFPFFIILAAAATPERRRTKTSRTSMTTSSTAAHAATFHILPDRVLIFKQATWLNDKVLTFVMGRRFLHIVTVILLAIVPVGNFFISVLRSRIVTAILRAIAAVGNIITSCCRRSRPAQTPANQASASVSSFQVATSEGARRRQRITTSSSPAAAPEPEPEPEPAHALDPVPVPAASPSPTMDPVAGDFITSPPSSPSPMPGHHHHHAAVVVAPTEDSDILLNLSTSELAKALKTSGFLPPDASHS